MSDTIKELKDMLEELSRLGKSIHKEYKNSSKLDFTGEGSKNELKVVERAGREMFGVLSQIARKEIVNDSNSQSKFMISALGVFFLSALDTIYDRYEDFFNKNDFDSSEKLTKKIILDIAMSMLSQNKKDE